MQRVVLRLPALAAQRWQPLPRRASHTAAACRKRHSSVRAASSPPLSEAPASREHGRPAWQCPACNQQCFKPAVLGTHLLRCCPDLLSPQEWVAGQSEEATLRALLKALQQREASQRQRSLDIAFRQLAPDGSRVRQGPPEVAAALAVPLARAERLLRAAMRAVPLAADTGPLEILYEDSDLLALNKPPGIITAPKHRYTGGSMVNRVIGTLGWEPRVLHRLDQDTSGVLLFARARDIVPAIHAQFRERSVRKEYLALAMGVPREPRFTVDAPIDRLEDHEVARWVSPDGKPAVTEFEVVGAQPDADLRSAEGATAGLCAPPGLLGTARGASLVRCAPRHGRTHQIRVHLAHGGHPILGDSLYGLMGPWVGRQALHASFLELRHPRSGELLRLRAPLPADMAAALLQLGLQQPKLPE